MSAVSFTPIGHHQMLRDITTSARINSTITPCIRHSKPRNLKIDKKRVQFDAEGTSPFQKRLMKAMAGERKQEKTRLQEPRTPKKGKRPEKPIIGSSSTWKEEQLERFKVQVGADLQVSEMIPEKWFDFGTLEHYQSGNMSVLKALIVARDDLLVVQPEDLSNDDVLLQKATHFYLVFSTLQSLQELKVTDSRKENLAGKRQEKRSQSVIPMPPLTASVPPIWTGPSAPPQTDEETRRVASISNPSTSSAGWQLFHACQETETQSLGNLFCTLVIRLLFRGDPSIGWSNRSEEPVLKWRSR